MIDKRRRIFSDEFKAEKVKDLEAGTVSISELCRLYSVSSTSICNWLYRFGNQHKKGVRMAVEKESESVRSSELTRRVAELERLSGQKQVEIEFLNRITVAGNEHFDCDLKKNFAPLC